MSVFDVTLSYCDVTFDITVFIFNLKSWTLPNIFSGYALVSDHPLLKILDTCLHPLQRQSGDFKRRRNKFEHEEINICEL